MEFILWTAVYWTIVRMKDWLDIARFGIEKHDLREEKRYSAGLRLLAYALQVFLWIWLYGHFIQ